MKRTALVVTALAATLAIGSACSKKQESKTEEASIHQEPEKDYLVMGEFVNAQDSLPRLRYFDGSQVSLNDRCAVRKVKLNPKMPPVYVNGQPIGFC